MSCLPQEGGRPSINLIRACWSCPPEEVRTRISLPRQILLLYVVSSRIGTEPSSIATEVNRDKPKAKYLDVDADMSLDGPSNFPPAFL